MSHTSDKLDTVVDEENRSSSESECGERMTEEARMDIFLSQFTHQMTEMQNAQNIQVKQAIDTQNSQFRHTIDSQNSQFGHINQTIQILVEKLEELSRKNLELSVAQLHLEDEWKGLSADPLAPLPGYDANNEPGYAGHVPSVLMGLGTALPSNQPRRSGLVGPVNKDTYIAPVTAMNVIDAPVTAVRRSERLRARPRVDYRFLHGVDIAPSLNEEVYFQHGVESERHTHHRLADERIHSVAVAPYRISDAGHFPFGDHGLTAVMTSGNSDGSEIPIVSSGVGCNRTPVDPVAKSVKLNPVLTQPKEHSLTTGPDRVGTVDVIRGGLRGTAHPSEEPDVYEEFTQRAEGSVRVGETYNARAPETPLLEREIH